MTVSLGRWRILPNLLKGDIFGADTEGCLDFFHKFASDFNLFGVDDTPEIYGP